MKMLHQNTILDVFMYRDISRNSQWEGGGYIFSGAHSDSGGTSFTLQKRVGPEEGNLYSGGFREGAAFATEELPKI